MKEIDIIWEGPFTLSNFEIKDNVRDYEFFFLQGKAKIKGARIGQVLCYGIEYFGEILFDQENDSDFQMIIQKFLKRNGEVKQLKEVIEFLIAENKKMIQMIVLLINDFGNQLSQLFDILNLVKEEEYKIYFGKITKEQIEQEAFDLKVIKNAIVAHHNSMFNPEPELNDQNEKIYRHPEIKIRIINSGKGWLYEPEIDTSKLTK